MSNKGNFGSFDKNQIGNYLFYHGGMVSLLVYDTRLARDQGSTPHWSNNIFNPLLHLVVNVTSG